MKTWGIVRFNVGLKSKPTRDDYSTVGRVLASFGIDGATIFPAVGIWRGEQEHSIVIDVVDIFWDTWTNDKGVKDVADKLRVAFDQDFVLVTEHSITASLVGD